MIEKTYSEETVKAVWGKGIEIPGYNSDLHREDICGAIMTYSEHGNRDSKYGWEIDHINPHGSDDLSNLRPLQWKNNLAKGDKRDGYWVCAVK